MAPQFSESELVLMPSKYRHAKPSLSIETNNLRWLVVLGSFCNLSSKPSHHINPARRTGKNLFSAEPHNIMLTSLAEMLAQLALSWLLQPSLILLPTCVALVATTTARQLRFLLCDPAVSFIDLRIIWSITVDAQARSVRTCGSLSLHLLLDE